MPMLIWAWLRTSVSSRRCASSIARVPQARAPSASSARVQSRRRGAVRHRELVSGRKPLEQSHGLLAGLHRLGYSTGTPENRRESAQRVPLTTPVAKPSVALDGALLRLDGLVRLVGQVALERAALEQLGPRLQRLLVREPERPRVLGGGLDGARRAKRPEPPLPARTRAPPPGHPPPRRGARAARARERRWVGRRAPRAPLMKSDPPVRRQRLLDGKARKLVAECDPRRGDREHAGGQAFVQLVDDIRCERLEEPELDRGRHDRRRLEQRARRGLRRAARASTASLTVSGISPSPAASTSVTKNGFPSVLR